MSKNLLIKFFLFNVDVNFSTELSFELSIKKINAVQGKINERIPIQIVHVLLKPILNAYQKLMIVQAADKIIRSGI
jgi:hypothetical protein